MSLNDSKHDSFGEATRDGLQYGFGIKQEEEEAIQKEAKALFHLRESPFFGYKGLQESFKILKVDMEETSKKTSSKAAPKKRKNSAHDVAAELEKLEKEVAAKTAETRVLRQQLVEGEIGLEAGLEEVNALRTLKALLFLENLLDRSLVDDLTRRIFG